MEQTNEAMVQQNPGGKRVLKHSRKPLVILCALAALLAAGYVGLCAYAGSLDTFYPNYYINGINMGGLTAAQAQEALEQKLLAQPILVTDEAETTQLSVTVADLGYKPEDFSGDAAFWMDAQQNVPFFSKGANFLVCLSGSRVDSGHWPDMDRTVLTATAGRLAEFFTEAPVDGRYALLDDAIVITKAKDGRTVDEAALLAALEDIAACCDNGYTVEVACETVPAKPLSAREVYDAVAGEAANAGYDSETDTITPETIGVEFDVSAAEAALLAAEPGTTIAVDAAITRPAVTQEALQAVLFRDVLGECRTHVSGTAARIGNVKLSAASINGIVLNAGEVFSYNETVGQRTIERGYQAAPAYVNGQTVDEVGGGICQTSSTLYLACLRGNLEITARYAHRFVPAYIDWGMDATVSWGGPDYQFTNNTGYPLKIVTEYEKNYLTVKVLGTNETGITAKMTAETLSTTPWNTVYEDDPTLAPGAEKVKTSPYTGYLVKSYRHLYDADGKWISTSFESTSSYKVRDKVILRGPAVTPPAPEVPVVAPVTPETPPVTPEIPPVTPEVPPVAPEAPDVPVILPVPLPEETEPAEPETPPILSEDPAAL